MNQALKITLTASNVILYFVALALWLSIPDELWLNTFLTLFNLSLTALLLYVSRKEFVLFLKSSVFKNMANALIGAFLIFCILGVVNYLAYKSPKAWDMTSGKINSLTAQTRNVLESLEGPLNVRIFAARQAATALKGLIELYRLEKADITIETIDPETRPDLVQQFEITKNGTIVFEYQDKKEQVVAVNELSVTNTLLKLSRTKNPELCFTTGHGEANLNEQKEEGFSYFKTLLQGSSYEIKEILTASLTEIPPSCDALVVLGPKLAFRDVEVEMIDEYLKSGKGAFIALGPDLNNDLFSNLRALLKTWGAAIANDLVIDTKEHISGSNGTVPMAQKFPKGHPIVDAFEGVVFFPLVSSIEEVQTSEDRPMSFHPLVRSSAFPASWAERNPQEIVDGALKYIDGVDMPGPITMAAALELEQEPNSTRLVVMGNASQLMNAYANYGKNFLLVMNSLSWISGEERLISFDVPTIQDQPVFISSPQLGLIFYFSVVFMPLVLLILAFFVYKRRRVL